jgi:membrane protein DedA with SNARE-associated domain
LFKNNINYANLLNNIKIFFTLWLILKKMDLISILLGGMEDRIIYSIIFFIYVVLTTLILPIPVEIGLFNPFITPVWLIFLLAIGKGVGAFLAFEIGTRVRGILKKRPIKIPLTKKIVSLCERFIRKYGYYGLFIIMSTPLMIDSVSLYLFSMLNPSDKGRRAMTRRWFVLINIGAGAVRGTIILLIAYLIGVRLV